MKKESLIKILNCQVELTKKSTRKDIVNLVKNMVNYHLKANADIYGINATRDGTGVNLGEVVEVILKSIANNKLEKSSSDKHYDMQVKGNKVEVKFATSDACAHAINEKEVVDYYLIATYSKANGGLVFKVPYASRKEIITNPSGRVVPNQKVKFLDKTWTNKVFAF